jgi:hypothetical protein
VHDILKALAMLGIGLLVAFFGLIWVANLFGVADEHARRIVRNPANQRMARIFGRPLDANEPMSNPGVALGRYLAGGGFMLVGAILAVVGVIWLCTGPPPG